MRHPKICKISTTDFDNSGFLGPAIGSDAHWGENFAVLHLFGGYFGAPGENPDIFDRFLG